MNLVVFFRVKKKTEQTEKKKERAKGQPNMTHMQQVSKPSQLSLILFYFFN
jgi:hypothetical protein